MAIPAPPKPEQLVDLCLNVIGRKGHGLLPKNLQGIPRHLLMQILQSLSPFELERLEENNVRAVTCIETESLWQLHYSRQWRHKGRWPEAYYQAAKHSSRLPEIIPWRNLYWQRHFQEVVNSTEAKTAVVHWHPESRAPPMNSKDGFRAKASELFLQQSAGQFGKYATYLRLHNAACIYLASHLDIFQEFASHVEFLEIYHLRENGVEAMCSLLQILLAKNLKSVGMCFAKARDIQLWNRILHISSTGSVASKPKVVPGNAKERKVEKTLKTVSQATPPPTPSPTTPKPVKLYVVQGQNDIHVDVINTSSQSFHTNGHSSLVAETATSIAHHTANGHIMTKTVAEGNTFNHISMSPIHLKDYDGIDMYDFTGEHKEITEVQDGEQMKNGNGIDSHLTFDTNELYSEMFHKNIIDIEEDASFSLNDLFGPNLAEDHEQIIVQSREEKDIVVVTEAPVLPTTPPATPEAVGGFSFLQHFELSSFWFHDDLLSLFAQSLRQWHNLESLVLRDNAIGFQSKGKILIDALIPLCLKGKLRYLRIEINPVDDDFVSLISEAMGTYCTGCRSGVKMSLRVLYLSSTKISAVGVNHLAHKLISHCTCPPPARPSMPDRRSSGSHRHRKRRLAVPSSASSSSSFKRHRSRRSTDSLPHKMMRDDVSHDSFSSSSSCFSSSSLDSDSQDSLSLDDLPQPKTIRVNPSEPHFEGLEELTLCSVIGDEGAITLASVLANNGTLKYLALPSCGIHTKGLASIFRAISGESSRKCNRTLKNLILKENLYEPSHDNSLAVLLKHGRLTELDISFCGLEVVSGDFISALCMNTILKSLNIAGNRLGDAGVTALSQMFSQQVCISSLIKLDLSYNQGTATSIATFASALHKFLPRRLEEINLAGNFLGSSVSKVMSSLRPLIKTVYAGNLDSSTIFADYISQM